MPPPLEGAEGEEAPSQGVLVEPIDEDALLEMGDIDDDDDPVPLLNLNAGRRFAGARGAEADKLSPAQKKARDAAIAAHRKKRFQGVDPNEALEAGRRFRAEMMNQDYRNIDGVEVTGARDNVLQAADQGVIEGTGEAQVDDDMPSLENLNDDMPSLEKLNDKINKYEKVLGSAKKRKELNEIHPQNVTRATAMLAKLKKQRRKRYTQPSRAFQRDVMRNPNLAGPDNTQSSVLDQRRRMLPSGDQGDLVPISAEWKNWNLRNYKRKARDSYETSEEFTINQLEDVEKDVALTKQMKKQRERADYLRRTAAQRLRYMPRVPKRGKKGDYQGAMDKTAVYALPTGMRHSKKKFEFDRPTMTIADEIISDADLAMQAQLEGWEDKNYNFMDDVVSFGIAAGTSAAFQGPVAAGGAKLGAVLGSAFGPVGSAVGATAGGIIGSAALGSASKKFADFLVKKLRKRGRELAKRGKDGRAKRMRQALERRRRRLLQHIELKTDYSRDNLKLAFAAAAGGTAQYLWNRLNPVPPDQRWRGPAHEMGVVYQLLPQDMRDLLNRARTNFPQMRGEANYTGPGATAADMAIGSWQTYLHRMAYMDPDHARPILRQLANNDNTNVQANQVAHQLFTDWTQTHAPDLMQNVFQRALESATLYSWYDALTKQKKRSSMGIIGKKRPPRPPAPAPKRDYQGLMNEDTAPGPGPSTYVELYQLGPNYGRTRQQLGQRPAAAPAMRPKERRKPKKRKRSRKRGVKKEEDPDAEPIQRLKKKIKIKKEPGIRPRSGRRRRGKRPGKSEEENVVKLRRIKREDGARRAKRKRSRPTSAQTLRRIKREDGARRAGLPIRGAKSGGGGVRRDTLLKLFKRLDKDKSGQLSTKELSKLSKRLKMSSKAIMRRMDKSGDNAVDFKEFAKFMRSRAA